MSIKLLIFLCGLYDVLYGYYYLTNLDKGYSVSKGRSSVIMTTSAGIISFE